MRAAAKRLLYWTPRIITILFALFVSLFAMDVFNEGRGLWETVAALAVHLIPTALLLLIHAISWRWEWIGGLLFIALGVFYVISTWGRFPWVTYLVMAGIPVLVGLLFLLNWRYRAELKSLS